MAAVTLTAAAHCKGCDWTAAGTPADVDKASDKHTAKGHPTATITRPCLSRECDC